jgi:hypothetical protein
MNDHWTVEETQALKWVCTYEDAADIAIKILKKMSANGHQVVQICGPMSTGGLGNFKDNMARFKKSIESAERYGLLVFNQLPFQDAIIRISSFDENSNGNQSYDMAILEVFYRKVFESGYVKKTLFLPGWQSSKGAQWERDLVESLGIVMEDYPVEWLE